MRLPNQLTALRHRPFLAFWLGSFASVGATQLQIMSQGWLVFELSGSTLMLGYLGAAAGAPAILVTLFGGAMADRMDRRVLLIVTSFLTSGLLLALGLATLNGAANAWHIIFVTGLISLISGLDWPTRQALLPSLIDRDSMMSAVALNAIVWQSCRMVFPALGGIIIALWNASIVLLLCSAGFAVMGIVIVRLQFTAEPTDTSRSALSQVTEGFRYIIGQRLFLVLLGLTYAMMLFGSSYMQLMPAVSTLLGAGSSGYGYLLSATGVGSVTGTLIIGNFQESRQLGRIMLMTAIAGAACLFLFSGVAAAASQFSTLVALTLGMSTAFAIAMFASMYLISSMTVIQLTVPDAMRGRVMSYHALSYSLMPLGGLVAGAIAAASSTPIGIGVSSLIYAIIILAFGVTQSVLRDFDGASVKESFMNGNRS
jgi:MFS family permease